MHVGKQGNAEVHHIPTENLGLPGALQSHGQSSGGGHGAHGGQVSRAVVLEDLNGAALGVGAGDAVQHRHPDEVTHQHDDDCLQEDGQLPGDGALVGQAREGAGDEEGQDGNDDFGNQIQHDFLELVQNLGGGFGLRPYGGKTHEHGEDQSGHDGHDLRNLKTEHVLGQGTQVSGGVGIVHDGDEHIAGHRGHQGCQHGRDVGNEQCHAQKTGGVAAQLGDGRSDKADDDQGNDEVDKLTHDVLDGHQHRHHGFGNDQADDDTDNDTKQQLCGETGKQLFHRGFLLSAGLPGNTLLLFRRRAAQLPTMILMISSLVLFMPSLPRRPMLEMVSSGVSPTRPSSGWKS